MVFYVEGIMTMTWLSRNMQWIYHLLRAKYLLIFSSTLSDSHKMSPAHSFFWNIVVIHRYVFKVELLKQYIDDVRISEWRLFLYRKLEGEYREKMLVNGRVKLRNPTVLHFEIQTRSQETTEDFYSSYQRHPGLNMEIIRITYSSENLMGVR